MVSIRKPAVSGAFYPESRKEIETMLSKFFGNVNNDKEFQNLKGKIVEKKLHGIIVPHAGWVYSGGVAAYAYNVVKELKNKGRNIKKIIMLGPNHTVYIDSAAVDTNKQWETPLGRVKVMKTKLNEEDIVYTSAPHEGEHDLEVQIPFLQHILGNEIEILPIIVGDIGDEGVEKLAELLIKNFSKEDILFLISTDLCHYQKQENAEKTDKNSIKIIETLDFEKMFMIDACGKNPLIVAMYICKKLGVKPKLLKYATSGDVSGDYNAVVGYAAMVF